MRADRLKVSSWEDADQTLAVLAERRRALKKCVVTRDAMIQKAKDQYVESATPIESEIEQLEDALMAFAQAHQDELDGRSKTLDRGRLGFLLVHELTVRSVKKAIDWLVEAKRLAFLRVKHELNKDALRDAAPTDVLKAIGAKLRDRDEFWYEVDGERHAVKR